MFAVVIFTTASVVLFYILIGYPLLLGWLARNRARPILKQPAEPTFACIIAVYNGEHYLAQKLESVLAVDYPRDRLDILVVSDGSTDQTDAIAESFADRGVRLMRVPRGGKPAALNAAIPNAKADLLLLTDVRQTLEPGSLRKLAACFSDPAVGVVSGDLRILAGTNQAEAQIKLYWRFETWIRNQLSLVDSMFGATGPFYAMRRELAGPMPPEILLDDMYLPLGAFFQGYRLVVEPEARAYDPPTSLQTEFRRKVRTLAGNYQLLTFYPQLLGLRNRMWLHYMSYKVARLLLPWVLVTILISTVFLPPLWRVPALLVQALGYGLALVDFYLPEGATLKRVTSPARTFLTMMVATVAGLSVFFVPPQRLWKVTSASSQQPVARS